MLVSFGPPGLLPLISIWSVVFLFPSEVATALTSLAAFSQGAPGASSSALRFSYACAQHQPFQHAPTIIILFLISSDYDDVFPLSGPSAITCCSPVSIIPGIPVMSPHTLPSTQSRYWHQQ